MRSAFGSVRLRLTLAAAAAVAVGLAAAAFGLVSVVEDTLVDRLRSDHRAAVDAVAERIEEGVLPRRLTFVGVRTRWVQVLAADGQVLAASPALVGSGPMLVEGRFVSPAPVAWEVTRVTVVSSGGPLTIVAASPLVEVQRSVDTLVNALWVGLPALVVLVGMLAWTIVGRALRPIDAIVAEADEISGTTINRRVPEPGTDDEVDRLARTMNRMLDRLESASERQRRFVSDASHELRSPVAAIRTSLEVALRRGDDVEWPEIARAVLAEDARIETLITDLLELARLDEGAPIAAEDVDLDDLVLDAVRRLDGHGPTVDTSAVSGARVRGSPRQLGLVLRNLLDNARRHAAARVAVRLAATDGGVELVVEDDGSGVPEADRERVFERFTRLEEGRSRDGGGAGLGLALVREVVRHHGGTVSVGDAGLGGARFVVTLPAARPDRSPA